MSRVIKFRGWNGKSMEKIYALHSNGIGATGGGDMIMDENIMQFTGLTDKNGADIYEGDIIRYVRKSTIETITRPVVFKDAGFMVEESESCDMPLCGICSDESHEGSHVGFVIGNIYQNPELLK